jgi:uncharacterized protein YndB with AHSA1/START domain
VTRPRWVLTAAALAGLLAAPAAAEWATIRDEDGVTVQEASAPGRMLPALLGTTTIAAPPRDVLSWLRDVSTYAQWMHNCEEARLLRDDGSVRFVYNRLHTPWPVSNRDVVLRAHTTTSPDGSARVEFRSTDEVRVPEVPSVVRMPRLLGHWELRPLASGGTRVEYLVDSDPGGSLPAWLVRRTARDLPWFTLVNLRRRVEAEGARGAD